MLSVRAKGSEEGAAAQRLRLGHIPAGSTDAVAYSINGTRSQMTAALHIAMGDRQAPPTRACVATSHTVDPDTKGEHQAFLPGVAVLSLCRQVWTAVELRGVC